MADRSNPESAPRRWCAVPYRDAATANVREYRGIAVSTGADYEPLLNGRLADLLRGFGIDARAEQRRHGCQLAVRAEVDHLVIALEAEIGNESGAWADADARLRQASAGEIDVHEAVAVVYAGDLTAAEFDADTALSWALLPERTFTSGNAASLAAVLRRVPQDHGDPDRIAKSLDVALEQAVQMLSAAQRAQLCAALDLPTARIVNGRERDVSEAAAKRALLVLACAAMFHTRLDDHLVLETRPAVHSATDEPYMGPWPPAMNSACVASSDVVGAIEAAWQAILAIDYRPIFESACRVLRAPAQNPRWTDAVRKVAAAAERAARHAAAARHDLLGRVFHWLLDTARYDGSYYTSSAAAAFLAELAIRPDDLPRDLSGWSVIDPACGTGTLLMAAAQRVHDIRGQATAAADGVRLIEECITGLDINTSACHMAATTLGLLSPSTRFHSMNIRRMLFGVQNPDAVHDSMLDARLGSLELLDPKAADVNEVGQGRLTTVHWSSGEHIDTGEPLGIPANSHRLVIMNPPYTRDSLRHDQLGPRAERSMKAREKRLTEGRSGHGSSSGTMFMDLGEHLASLDESSTLAVVFPLAGAAAPSALPMRKLLGQWFHVEWVIASHDSHRPWFSENTTISEMLIVARRHPADAANRPPTRFVRLRRNPRTAAEAIQVAAALNSGDGGGARQAEVTSWPAQRMASGRWAPLGITSAHLTAVGEEIAAGEMMPVASLGGIAAVGPAGQRIRDAFTKHPLADAHGRRALWHNDTGTIRTMRAGTDSYIHAKPDKADLADSYWAQRSRLLLAANLRLNTARSVAVRLDQPAVGSGWIPIRPHAPDGDVEMWTKVLATWLNSTLGIITITSAASPKTLSRLALSLDAIRSLPIPSMTASQASAMAGAYDQWASQPFQALANANEGAYIGC